MSEPTIDEMLEFLQGVERSMKTYPPSGFKQEFLDAAWGEADRILKGLRAILEQHRDTGNIYVKVDDRLEQVYPGPAPVWPIDLESIRAFVERVEDRWKNCRGDNLLSYTPFQDAMKDELAAMETANARTND